MKKLVQLVMSATQPTACLQTHCRVDLLLVLVVFLSLATSCSKETCTALVTQKLNPCLMHYAGVSDEALLPGVDCAKAFATYPNLYLYYNS